MRTALILILLLPGCARQAGGTNAADDARSARLLASLIECAARDRLSGLDAARAQAAADSVLKGQSWTREEFLAEVRALNSDVTRWRGVSEEAARILEQRLAEAGAQR